MIMSLLEQLFKQQQEINAETEAEKKLIGWRRWLLA